MQICLFRMILNNNIGQKKGYVSVTLILLMLYFMNNTFEFYSNDF